MSDDELPVISQSEPVRVEEIARQAVVLLADILSRFSCQGDQISTVWMTGAKRDEWGRQVLGWQAELDGTTHDHD